MTKKEIFSFQTKWNKNVIFQIKSAIRKALSEKKLLKQIHNYELSVDETMEIIMRHDYLSSTDNSYGNSFIKFYGVKEFSDHVIYKKMDFINPSEKFIFSLLKRENYKKELK